MLLALYCFSASFLIISDIIVFCIFVRRDYMQKGHLTPFSTFLELFIWMLYMCFPYTYNPPSWPSSHDSSLSGPVTTVGWTLIAIGAATAFPAMASLGFRRSMGQDSKALKRTGFYRITRNPQILGGSLLVFGSVLLWPSWYAAGWLVLYAVMAHTMVLTEEEHLHKVHGNSYAHYCMQVPRYIGFRHQL